MSKGLTEAALAPATDLFVMVCRADLDLGARLGVIAPKRAVVIHNAVDCDRFEPERLASSGAQVRSVLGIAPEEIMGLFVGRFHRQKDLFTLLAAWARLPVEESRARLVLVVIDRGRPPRPKPPGWALARSASPSPAPR